MFAVTSTNATTILDVSRRTCHLCHAEFAYSMLYISSCASLLCFVVFQVSRSKFGGLVLMGPSRFSHNAPLCELLPVALPSLVLAMSVTRQNFTLEVSLAMLSEGGIILQLCCIALWLHALSCQSVERYGVANTRTHTRVHTHAHTHTHAHSVCMAIALMLHLCLPLGK